MGSISLKYRIDPKYSDRTAGANGVDPDQIDSAASDQGQHFLPLVQQFYTSIAVK